MSLFKSYKTLSNCFYHWTDQVVAANILSNAIHHFQFSVTHRYFVKLIENRDLCVRQRENMGKAAVLWTQRKEKMAIKRWIEFCYNRQRARDRMLTAIQAAEDNTMAKGFRSWRANARSQRASRENLQVAVVFMQRTCLVKAMLKWSEYVDEKHFAHNQVS